MLAFIIRRLLQAVLVMTVVGFVAFSLFRYVGDPVANMLGQEATLADREEARKNLGLDQPFPVQFFRFVTSTARGEFGDGRQRGGCAVEENPAVVEDHDVLTERSDVLGLMR